ncbi:cytochrome b/b6 domain-containing protein [Yoonia sp.]|uniref:cytochrome b/b6 domain-containing protein n=1 Tax=Yoonia sp. TaxID=2212373 RepID=UPI003F6B0E48
MIRVWDIFVRIFHWSLVAAVAVAWLTGDEWDDLHVIAGYVVAGLVAARLVWGLVGGKYARFSQFLRAPGTVLAYLRDVLARRERRYLGHNPAGAAMIVALLLVLVGTALSGWLLENPVRLAQMPDLPQIIAPAYADGNDDRDRDEGGGSEIVEELHEVLANFLLILITLHVAGVVLASVRHRENLARAMITGDKRTPEPGDVV